MTTDDVENMSLDAINEMKKAGIEQANVAYLEEK